MTEEEKIEIEIMKLETAKIIFEAEMAKIDLKLASNSIRDIKNK